MSEKKKKFIIQAIKVLLGLAVTVVCLYLIGSKVDVQKSMVLFSRIPYYYFIILLGLYAGAFFFRTVRWKIALSNIGFFRPKILLSSIIVGYAGNNVLPARAGEFVRMNFFSRNTGVSRLTALSSIGVERIVDGIVLLIFLIVAAISTGKINSEKEWFTALVYLATMIFAGALGVIVFLRLFDKKISLFLNNSSRGLVQKLERFYHKVRDAIDFIHFDFTILKVFILTGIVWFLEGLMFYFSIKAINGDATIAQAILCQTVVNFGLLVPSSPAYVGVFQGLTILCLALFNIPEETSLSISIMVHITQFIPVTILGVIIYVTNMVNNKRKPAHLNPSLSTEPLA